MKRKYPEKLIGSLYNQLADAKSELRAAGIPHDMTLVQGVRLLATAGHGLQAYEKGLLDNAWAKLTDEEIKDIFEGIGPFEEKSQLVPACGISTYTKVQFAREVERVTRIRVAKLIQSLIPHEKWQIPDTRSSLLYLRDLILGKNEIEDILSWFVEWADEYVTAGIGDECELHIQYDSGQQTGSRTVTFTAGFLRDVAKDIRQRVDDLTPLIPEE